MDFIKNLRFQLLLIFLVPAVGMLYFSFGYVNEKFDQYRKTIYLESISNYVETATRLIKELQKERGLSIASLSSSRHDFFQKELARQREKTDRVYRTYAQLLQKEGEQHDGALLKRIVNRYAEIALCRQKVESGTATVEEVFRYYSRLVSDLIESTDMLRSAFVNESFFRLVDGYRTLLILAESNGKERALIAYILEKGEEPSRFRQWLYRIEARSENELKRIEEEANVIVEVIYHLHVPKPLEARYRKIKREIIYDNRFDVVRGDEWWRLASQYINAVYAANTDIMQHLLKLKERLKKEAYRSLVISLALWLLALLALYALIYLFNRIINAYGEQVRLTARQQKIYKAFSEFSETLIYNENIQVILHTMATILYQTGQFVYVWIARVDSEERILPVCTENISSALIDQEMNRAQKYAPRLRRELLQVARKGRYEIAIAGLERSPLYHDAESFGLFPLYQEGDDRYVLVVGVASANEFDAHTIDLIGRMSGALKYAVEKIAIKQQEEALKEELKVMASAFNAQEAITITDASGRIIKVNDAFTRITGYTPEEVIGHNPSILKSGKHDKTFYIEMWDAIRKQGYWKGEIYNKRKNGEVYPELLSISAVTNEEGEVTHYVAHFFDITDLKAAQARAEFQAQHDPLTELANRQKLMEELERIYRYNLQTGLYSAFIYFDLDNFKHINDFFTHEVGDKVLIEVAARLKALAFEEDVVARLGGDEFAFIAANLDKDRTEAIKKVSILVEKIEEAFASPLEIEGVMIDISFSIGVKIFPGGEKSVQEVIVDADVAMYHAKKNGKNQHKFFDERLDLQSKQFLMLKNEFTGALQKGELVVHYQPQVEIEGGRICGLEAMVRWNHPERGMLYPDEFLYVTTSNRLNFDMTVYVLRRVSEDIRRWIERNGSFDCRVAVNISGAQFNRKDFDQKILKVIEEIGIDPVYLEFEIVEDVLMKDIEHAITLIHRFKEYGIHFSIDDFGTGYSSINYLKKLPVNALKIDKSFIQELFSGNNSEIVRMIIETAHIFGLKCIAEGVETDEVLEYLRICECDCYQGYFFSKPVSADEVAALLQEVHSP